MPAQRGDQFGTVIVELVEPDARAVRNPEFMREWRSRIRLAAGIESFSIAERRPGPPGRDVDIRLTEPGNDVAKLKAAALELAGTLGTIRGVSGIDDDMPFGHSRRQCAVVYRARRHHAAWLRHPQTHRSQALRARVGGGGPGAQQQ
jgi:hypothetical protein